MTPMRNPPAWDPADLEKSIKILNEGGTLLYPTDTVWGIGSDAENAQAVDRIFEIKQRPKEKAMIILVAEWASLGRYLDASPSQDLQARLQAEDRPVTLILEGARGLPESLLGPGNSLAIRCTQDPFCRALIQGLGRPIVSSSANLSATATPTHFGEIDPRIKSSVDYIVRYRQNDRQPGKPSKIWKLHEDGSMTILRP